MLGAITIDLNPDPELVKVVPSNLKPASPCIADALVAVMTRLSAPFVIGKPPLNDDAVTIPVIFTSPITSN